MHAGESYPASGLSGEITPLLLLCGVSAWSLSQDDYNGAPGAVSGGRRERGWFSPLWAMCLSLSRSEPFAWVPRGVYIGLPPGGTMVIRLGVGPSRLSHMLTSFPPASGARRLVGPAARLDIVAALLLTQVGHWVVATVPPSIGRSLSPSSILSGSWGPGQESADSREADSHRSVFGRPGRLRPTH